MYRGRYQQGDEIPLAVLCRDGGNATFAPTEAPLMQVFLGTTKLASKRIPPLDPISATALFGYRLFLGTSYTTGRYSVVYHYRNGSTYYLAQDVFEIAAGGHKDGDVIAMAYYERPQANFVVQQLSSGRIIRGRSPRRE